MFAGLPDRVNMCPNGNPTCAAGSYDVCCPPDSEGGCNPSEVIKEGVANHKYKKLNNVTGVYEPYTIQELHQLLLKATVPDDEWAASPLNAANDPNVAPGVQEGGTDGNRRLGGASTTSSTTSGKSINDVQADQENFCEEKSLLHTHMLVLEEMVDYDIMEFEVRVLQDICLLREKFDPLLSSLQRAQQGGASGATVDDVVNAYRMVVGLDGDTEHQVKIVNASGDYGHNGKFGYILELDEFTYPELVTSDDADEGSNIEMHWIETATIELDAGQSTILDDVRIFELGEFTPEAGSYVLTSQRVTSNLETWEEEDEVHYWQMGQVDSTTGCYENHQTMLLTKSELLCDVNWFDGRQSVGYPITSIETYPLWHKVNITGSTPTGDDVAQKYHFLKGQIVGFTYETLDEAKLASQDTVPQPMVLIEGLESEGAVTFDFQQLTRILEVGETVKMGPLIGYMDESLPMAHYGHYTHGRCIDNTCTLFGQPSVNYFEEEDCTEHYDCKSHASSATVISSEIVFENTGMLSYWVPKFVLNVTKTEEEWASTETITIPRTMLQVQIPTVDVGCVPDTTARLRRLTDKRNSNVRDIRAGRPYRRLAEDITIVQTEAGDAHLNSGIHENLDLFASDTDLKAEFILASKHVAETSTKVMSELTIEIAAFNTRLGPFRTYAGELNSIPLMILGGTQKGQKLSSQLFSRNVIYPTNMDMWGRSVDYAAQNKAADADMNKRGAGGGRRLKIRRFDRILAETIAQAAGSSTDDACATSDESVMVTMEELSSMSQDDLLKMVSQRSQQRPCVVGCKAGTGSVIDEHKCMAHFYHGDFIGASCVPSQQQFCVQHVNQMQVLCEHDLCNNPKEFYNHVMTHPEFCHDIVDLNHGTISEKPVEYYPWALENYDMNGMKEQHALHAATEALCNGGFSHGGGGEDGEIPDHGDDKDDDGTGDQVKPPRAEFVGSFVLDGVQHLIDSVAAGDGVTLFDAQMGVILSLTHAVYDMTGFAQADSKIIVTVCLVYEPPDFPAVEYDVCGKKTGAAADAQDGGDAGQRRLEQGEAAPDLTGLAPTKIKVKITSEVKAMGNLYRASYSMDEMTSTEDFATTFPSDVVQSVIDKFDHLDETHAAALTGPMLWMSFVTPELQAPDAPEETDDTGDEGTGGAEPAHDDGGHATPKETATETQTADSNAGATTESNNADTVTENEEDPAEEGGEGPGDQGDRLRRVQASNYKYYKEAERGVVPFISDAYRVTARRLASGAGVIVTTFYISSSMFNHAKNIVYHLINQVHHDHSNQSSLTIVCHFVSKIHNQSDDGTGNCAAHMTGNIYAEIHERDNSHRRRLYIFMILLQLFQCFVSSEASKYNIFNFR